MVECSFIASTVAKPAPHERPTETSEHSVDRKFVMFGACGGGNESTPLRAIAEGYEGAGDFGNN